MSPRRQHHAAATRHRVPAGAELPRQRAGSTSRPCDPRARTETGGSVLVASTFPPRSPSTTPDPAAPEPRGDPRLPGGSTAFRDSPRARGIASDVAALLLAVLDVWLVIPEDAPTYSIWLSAIAVAAMVMRRHVPFLAVLVTVPGFMTGWSQLAAMIALGSLAKKHRLLSWRMVVGSILVFLCGYVRWPLSEFVALSWQEHALNVIWAVIIAGHAGRHRAADLRAAGAVRTHPRAGVQPRAGEEAARRDRPCGGTGASWPARCTTW